MIPALCLPWSPLVSHGVSGCWGEMIFLVSHGMSGCCAEMIYLCLPLFPLTPLVSHGVSGCWGEMIFLVSHGMSGRWAEMILLCLPLSPMVCLDAEQQSGERLTPWEIWRQEWIGQRRKLRLPLLFGVDAGVMFISRI